MVYWVSSGYLPLILDAVVFSYGVAVVMICIQLDIT
jgi:hypothetical protein